MHATRHELAGDARKLAGFVAGVSPQIRRLRAQRAELGTSGADFFLVLGFERRACSTLGFERDAFRFELGALGLELGLAVIGTFVGGARA